MFFPSYVGASSGGEQTIVDVGSLPSGSAIKNVIYRTPGGGDASEFKNIEIAYDAARTISDYSDELTINGFDDPTIASNVYTFIPNAIIKYTYNDTDYTVSSLVLTNSTKINVSINVSETGVTIPSYDLETGTSIKYKEAPLYIYYAGDHTNECFTRLVDLSLYSIINNDAVYSGEEEGTSEIVETATADVSCSTSSSTAAKEAYSETYSLTSGNRFSIYFSNSNTSASAITLNINSTGAKPIFINGYTSSSTNYYLPAGLYEAYYDGTNYYIRTDGGIDATNMFYFVDEENTTPIDAAGTADCICKTASATADKVVLSETYALNSGNMFTMYLVNSNSAASALTLNVAGTGVKPLYINGTVSSSTNYSLPAGNYLVYYDGTNYYVRIYILTPQNKKEYYNTRC